MRGLENLPVPLQRYLLLVIAAGPVLALAVFATAPFNIVHTDLLAMGLLVALSIIAERTAVHFTHKLNVSVVTAFSLALVLVGPAAVVGLLALLAGFMGQLLRRRGDWIEAAFNTSVASIAVVVSVTVFATFRDIDVPGPDFVGVGTPFAVLAAALALHLTESVLVAYAAALQLGSQFLPVLLVQLRNGLVAHAALAALGLTAGHLAVAAPVLLPTLALPLWLIRIVVQDAAQLREDTHHALAALVEVVELRDPYTAGHSRRVGELAHVLALRVGLTHEEADRIAAAGRVHDVGKVAVDPAVLMKPGKLTAEEITEMQRHPVLGGEVIAQFAAFRDGRPYVRHHHEAWDGSGYPDKLRGDAIPFGARILAVADTYDALTSARPYRTAISLDRARTILQEGAGTQWDPVVVKALLAYLDHVGGAQTPPSPDESLPAVPSTTAVPAARAA